MLPCIWPECHCFQRIVIIFCSVILFCSNCHIIFELSFHFVRSVILLCLSCHYSFFHCPILFSAAEIQTDTAPYSHCLNSFYFVSTVIVSCSNCHFILFKVIVLSELLYFVQTVNLYWSNCHYILYKLLFHILFELSFHFVQTVIQFCWNCYYIFSNFHYILSNCPILFHDMEV